MAWPSLSDFSFLGPSLSMTITLSSKRGEIEMAGEDEPEAIVEERAALMVPFTAGANPTRRVAHFIKPSMGSINQQSLPISLPPSFPVPEVEPDECPLKLIFTGWLDPPQNWETWVHQMHSVHQFTWKKAGIYEAIMSSIYLTRRNHHLFWGLAERWCRSTNSFIFPWGEATITLEDVMVLGGFPVIGEPLSKPLETSELMKMEEELLELHTEAIESNHSTHQQWMKQFMGWGSELEHVAFLALWLARCVFSSRFQNTIETNLFPVAIHLARGTRLAIGPAVLASIYRDLSLFKETIVASTESWICEGDDDVFSLTLPAPLRLVQVWAWERFPGVRPDPNAIKDGEPRLARWHKSKRLKIGTVRMILDSAEDIFQWRPYVTAVRNWPFPKFYIEKGEWMMVAWNLDQELQSYAQCLRVCELVGMDCVELYLPHRVAMQFGIDQDIPCVVTKSDGSPETAWRNYCKPIWNSKLYVPSRLFEADVTAEYLAWWKQSLEPPQAAFMGVIRRRRSSRRCGRSLWWLTVKKEVDDDDDDAEVPPGCPPKCNMAHPKNTESRLCSPKGKIADDDAEVPPGFLPKCNLAHPKTTESNLSSPKGKMADDDADVPPGFPPKGNVTHPKTTGSNPSRPKGKIADADADVRPGFQCRYKLITRIKGIMQNEALPRSSEGAAKNAKGSDIPKMNDNGGQHRSSTAVDIPGLELEARIQRLERVVAELKRQNWATCLASRSNSNVGADDNHV